MSLNWSKKIPAITALCALVLMRMVDLAVFDPVHDHITAPHVQAHASEMTHNHDVDEPSEHASPEDMTVHVSFHTLLSAYMSAPYISAMPTKDGAETYQVYIKRHANNAHSRPPVPPPLA